ADLSDRNIRLAELAYGSAKAQQLFREMMEQAMAECHFNTENTPLVIEAIPLSTENVMVIVTKVAESSNNDERANLAREVKKQKRRIRESTEKMERGGAATHISIFSFGTLDEAANASTRLAGVFFGDNSLYKSEGRFYLLINNTFDGFSTEAIELILGEYGQKHLSSKLSATYLGEHGELIIAENAVDKLASTLSCN
ncbi:MAG: adaptor protein MecA, partial [Clostridiales bacterium]|nr:adaptor protein MecA [Clostridiales bacterium]